MITQFSPRCCWPESGITHIDRFDASKFPTRFSGQIRGFHAEGYIDDKSDRRLEDYLRYCIVAGKKALKSTNLGGERLDKCMLDTFMSGRAAVNWKAEIVEIRFKCSSRRRRKAMAAAAERQRKSKRQRIGNR
ncbi:hypothetical protein SASPL_134799 [Salvia splendens]|uniref:beta-ketoacyl-[acyl-carrier-protein] synthase I n=1 Tax=Salvia splendens TaxID=180675 RepID=A0A8X8ZF85_SALSN|nr:hypothetical protein SASPL_134799 [Salvia splendens]